MIVAVSAVSSAAILVRFAEGAPPIALGFWRTLIVGILMAAWIRPVARRDLGLSALAGFFLAGHFWAWFESLSRTTVLHSTLLVCLGPIWLGVAEWGWLRKPPSRRFWMGVGLALMGALLMAGQSADVSQGGIGPTLSGDLLALLGGFLAAAYLFVGQDVRKRVGIACYSALFSLSAAFFLLPAALLTQQHLTGFSLRTWGFVVALALGPQLLGHNGVNYCLRYVRASTLSAMILLEPLGAAILAAMFFHEIPGKIEAFGGFVVLIGVLIATRTAGEPESDAQPALG
jgi:drug/metabolite transporter (DMT)-like permease